MRQEMSRFKWHIGTMALVYSLTNVFIQPYTAFLGLNAAQYAYFASANVLVLASSQFIFGYLCDKFQTIRLFLKGMMIIVMALGLSIFAAQSFLHLPTIVILLMILVMQLFQGPLLTLSENWIMLSPKRLSLFFGNIRMYASLAWGVTAFVFGMILVGTRIQYLPLLVAVLYIFPLIFNSRLNDISNRRVSAIAHTDVKTPMNKDEKRRLLLFALFAITAILFYLSGRYFAFLGFLFQDVGIPKDKVPSYIGWTVALMALSELPLFGFGKQVITKIGAYRLFLLAVMTSLVRVVIMYFFPNPYVYIACGLFQGIVYPSYLLSLRSISKTLVTERVFNTVYGLFTLLVTVSEMIFIFFLGNYVNQHQVSVVYAVCVCSAILSLVVFAIFYFRTQHDVNKEKEA